MEKCKRITIEVELALQDLQGDMQRAIEIIKDIEKECPDADILFKIYY